MLNTVKSDFLEEQVAVVYDAGLIDKVLHEIAYILHTHLAATLHLCISIVFSSRTLYLLYYLEKINTSIALNRIL